MCISLRFDMFEHHVLTPYRLYRDNAFCTNVTILVHFDVCTISTHFASIFCTNQNVPIATLVQNALYWDNSFCTNVTIGTFLFFDT